MKKNRNTPKTGDPFLDSLYEYAPDKSEVVVARPKKAWVPYLIRWGALALCLTVLIGSVASILESMVGYREAGDYYDSLAELWNGAPDEDGNLFGSLAMGNKDNKHSMTADFANAQSGNNQEVVEEVEADSETLTLIRARLSALRQQNDDLAGWISIPNSRIDYPVVHTNNNDYYLNHAFDRSFLAAGAIFIDYRNSKDFSKNYNTVIYGHNMLSGAMFSCISDFFSRSYFNENRYIYIYTDEGIFVYKTFNVYKVKIDKDVSYIKTRFESGEEFVEFCNTMKKKSAVKVDDVDFNENDRIITLSTCTNAHNDNERYCLQAKLVEIQK